MKTIKDKIPSLIISVFVGLLSLGLQQYFGVDKEQSALIASLLGLLVLIITLRTYRKLRQKLSIILIKSEIEENGQGDNFLRFRNELGNILGNPSNSDTLRWHESYRVAEKRLANLVPRSKSIKILSNNGKSDFGKGTRLYDAISQNKTAQIKILIAHPDSPFVSPEWAIQNGYSKQQSRIWIEKIKIGIADIERLKSYHHIDISVRGYKLPFTWHLWIFEDLRIAFVSAWLDRSRNFETIRVYEISSSDSNANMLFEMFDNYFERIWHEHAENLL